MGKVLVAINAAGFFLNILVFLMVVQLSSQEGGSSDKPAPPAGPSLESIAGKLEQVLDKKLAKLAAMDTKLQSLSSKVDALAKKIPAATAISARMGSPEATPAVERAAPSQAPEAVEPPAEPAPAAQNPPAARPENKPEEKNGGEEKAPEAPQENRTDNP